MLQRRYILCYNPREAQRERKHREQVVKELEEELKSHSDSQATARWAIDLLASGRYKRYLTIDKQDRIRLNREAIQQASKHDGKWVLQTNDDTITVEDAAAGYKGLLVIERAFRTLRTQRFQYLRLSWTSNRHPRKRRHTTNSTPLCKSLELRPFYGCVCLPRKNPGRRLLRGSA